MPCEKPFINKGVPCPCGKCESCAKRRASGWSFRILKEAELKGSAFFVTLTYDNEHCPMKYRTKAPDKHGNGEEFQKTQKPTVDITHLQKFIKKVRKSNHSKSISYYAVSEYGSESYRPHYHIILMGIDIISFVGIENWEEIKRGKLKLDGYSQMKIKDWENGHITIGKVTPASIGYTLKYISKGRQIPQYIGDKRQKEKSLMSKGIGKSYLIPAVVKQHQLDPMRQYCVTVDSKKIPLPRYYKDRLYDHLERQILADLYASIYLEKIENMGEFERKKEWLKKRAKIKDEVQNNSRQRIGKNDKL